MRGTAFLAMLGAAVALPYLLNGHALSTGWLGSLGEKLESRAGSGAAGSTTATGDAATAAALAAPAVSRTLYDLQEILRFDVDPAGVVRKFPRVTTGMSDLELQGYRTPLVTGTAEDDLAGSLTYFFDSEQKLKRITFYGTTGDPRKVVTTVCRLHDLAPTEPAEPGSFVYETRKFGAVSSQLRIRPARLVRADTPRARYEVEMVLAPKT